MSPKDPAAVALGRKGGKARVANMSKDELSDANRRAAEARWKKQREQLEKTVATITEGTKHLEKTSAKRAKQKKKSK